VHILPESPGFILKAARERAGITVEALAETANVSKRYIYRIENEGKKPSYDVLHHLIRALDMSPDLLFYPETQSNNPEIDQLIHMLYKCDDRDLEVIKATVTALINTAPEKQS
jgi:transcriptional regulator with XRE-family HTH domain